MPDVDEAVRLLTKACTTDFYNRNITSKRAVINAFLNLSEDNRPVITRKKTNSQIEEFFKRLYPNLSKIISKHFGHDVLLLKEDSKNNRKGSDLIATINYNGRIEEERIELKFGQETLRAIGLETFDKIFPIDKNKGFYAKAFAKVKENQRAFAKRNKGKVDLLISNLEKQLLPIINKSNELAENGCLQINSKEIAILLSSTGSIDSKQPLVIPTKLNVGWKSIKVSEKLDLTGDWKITEISPSKEKGARINFIVTNGRVEAKFLLHWKNDMVFDGFKYPSRTGINTYCFNVWAWRK